MSTLSSYGSRPPTNWDHKQGFEPRRQPIVPFTLIQTHQLRGGAYAPPGLVHPLRQLQRADVLDDGFRPAIDVRPLAVADTVLIRRHVDHVTLLLRRGYGIVCLL